MKNDLSLLVKDIPQDDLQMFMKNTTANTEVRKVVHKVSVDYSWVDVLDEAIPYLDTIIRNPRRFIASEEDIIPIEKTKRVSQESVKHLATHTNLIQEVDDDDFVKPLKLLNVFREETIDLYENRFIYSLIKNLQTFVREQLTYKEKSTSNLEEKSVNYKASTIYRNRKIDVNLNLVSKNLNADGESEDILAKREEKIKHINDILEDFMASRFMKAMTNATPVRSPIRKTNVILKEQNFIKALELWEFLETFQIQKPVKEYNEDANITNKAFEKDFGMTYFLNYGILNGVVTRAGTLSLPETINLPNSVYEYARKFEVDENAFRKELEAEIDKAVNYKKQEKQNAKIHYDAFIENHRIRMRKASLLFK